MNGTPERLWDEPSTGTTSLSLLRPEQRAIELCDTLQATCTSLDRMIERVSSARSPRCSESAPDSIRASSTG